MPAWTWLRTDAVTVVGACALVALVLAWAGRVRYRRVGVNGEPLEVPASAVTGPEIFSRTSSCLNEKARTARRPNHVIAASSPSP